MPIRARALTLIALFLGGMLSVAGPPAQTLAAGPKVAIIVGPVGSLTSTYRGYADDVAGAATSAGATVVKAYSPNATWANVRAAVNGANVIVYFGHGNGFPNPYGETESTDRTNGWGLNRTTTNGDADNWSSTMAYCGEKALLGTLTSTDGSVQWDYCGGSTNTDGITPAANFTMIYGQAHYAPGFGERYVRTDPLPTLTEAQQRVRNYSYPVLKLGATGYIATAYGDTADIVARVLNGPETAFADIFRAGKGYSAATLTTMSHPDISDAQVWVQSTSISMFHFGEPDYWYAFAGDPHRTPSGAHVLYGGLFKDIWGSAFRDNIVWLAESGITTGCGPQLYCPTGLVTREQMASFLARALALPSVTTDYFTDDDGSSHEADINRLAASGITGGCGDGTFCPRAAVTREQMASFLARALRLPTTSTDFFTDDNGSGHEADINRMAASGVTGGCGPSRFCPSVSVTREQMAAFLHRALAT